MKKLVVAVAAVLVCGLGGVLGYFAWPKDKPVDLQVSVQDITVEVGQTVEIEWWTNVEEALTVFSTEDERIAKIAQLTENNSITGIKVGETKLTLVAKYEGVRAEASAKVTVVEKESEDESPSQTPDESPSETPNEEDSSNECGDSGESEQPNEQPEEPTEPEAPEDNPAEETPEEVLDATEIIKKCTGCSFESNRLYIDISETRVEVQIKGNNPIFEYDNSEMTITLTTGIQNNYKIVVNAVGEYELKITIGDKTYKITVEVS